MAEIGTDIDRAKQLLLEGKLVAIPTETVYGLAANALDADAINRIFKAKNRPLYDPLIVHIKAKDELNLYAETVPEWAARLAERFWPGPLTLILRKTSLIPDLVTSGHETVGLRVPAHPLTRRLLEFLPFPLAAPSANPFGYVSPTTPQHVQDQLGDNVEYILDGGPSNVGLESTIVGEESGKPTVLRLGGTKVEDIESAIGTVAVNIRSVSNPANPGSLESHYAPQHPLFFDDLPRARENGSRIGTLTFSETVPGIPAEQQMVLSPEGDLSEAAEKLFAALRALDRMPIDAIYAERFPEEGLGRAINDRLSRASVKRVSNKF